MALTKSLFTTGLQCPRLLWWTVHEPGAVELQPDKVLLDRFDQGKQVGALAREEFGADATFEGAYEAEGVRIRADVLLREGEGWRLIEVKSTTSQKDEHIADAAIQAHVLRANDIDVRGVEIMHLNKEFRHPDGGSLFARTDVTAAVDDVIGTMPERIALQLRVLEGALPEQEIGAHCDEPRACVFKERCWPKDPEHISKLYAVGPKRAAEYMATGVHRIPDIPPAKKLTFTAKRQIRAMRENRLIVEPTLAAALEPFTGRLGFLDFETIMRAVPVWPGMAPWEQAAAQFSYHELQADGRYTHAEYLADGAEDARPPLARAMVEATKNAERVVMYTSFEKTRIRSLQQTVPALRPELEALEAKLIDLHPVIRDCVYHPDFGGSFSIKAVLTPLVPDLTYSDLVIVNGLVASVEIARLLFVAQRIAPEERDRVRQELLDYCERDTWAMARLLEELKRLC
jgi:predicted RecB family nuclease